MIRSKPSIKIRDFDEQNSLMHDGERVSLLCPSETGIFRAARIPSSITGVFAKPSHGRTRKLQARVVSQFEI